VEAARRAGLREPEGAFVSGVSGRWAGSEVAQAEYWGRQAREAVRFGEGVEEVLGSGGEWYLLEVGAGRGLAALARQVVRGGKRVSAGGMGHECGATLSGAEARGAGKGEGKREARGEARGERQGEARGMVRELGRLWESGVAIGGGERGGRRVTLPTYPFERQSFWIDPPHIRKPVAAEQAAAEQAAAEQARIVVPEARQPKVASDGQLETLPLAPAPLGGNGAHGTAEPGGAASVEAHVADAETLSVLERVMTKQFEVMAEQLEVLHHQRMFDEPS